MYQFTVEMLVENRTTLNKLFAWRAQWVFVALLIYLLLEKKQT